MGGGVDMRGGNLQRIHNIDRVFSGKGIDF
jgi:hypothetical protein